MYFDASIQEGNIVNYQPSNLANPRIGEGPICSKTQPSLSEIYPMDLNQVRTQLVCGLPSKIFSAAG